MGRRGVYAGTWEPDCLFWWDGFSDAEQALLNGPLAEGEVVQNSIPNQGSPARSMSDVSSRNWPPCTCWDLLESLEVGKLTSVCSLAGVTETMVVLCLHLHAPTPYSNANSNPRRAKLRTATHHTLWKEGLAAHFKMSNSYWRPRQNPVP